MALPSDDHPENVGETITESKDSIFVAFDGPGDTTVRPRPANVPREWPYRPARPQASQSEPPSNGPTVAPK